MKLLPLLLLACLIAMAAGRHRRHHRALAPRYDDYYDDDDYDRQDDYGRRSRHYRDDARFEDRFDWKPLANIGLNAVQQVGQHFINQGR
uniref:Sulfakinin n=1 Tax=Panagrellus redivivus TaxID=6233 RepID=A0A7E4UQX9_PANRE